VCKCFEGLTGNGLNCQDIDECTYKPCNQFARCINTFSSYHCECINGYRNNIKECVEIDECEEKIDDCHDNAVCINLNGTFKCNCKPGFFGNGSLCEGNSVINFLFIHFIH